MLESTKEHQNGLCLQQMEEEERVKGFSHGKEER